MTHLFNLPHPVVQFQTQVDLRVEKNETLCLEKEGLLLAAFEEPLSLPAWMLRKVTYSSCCSLPLLEDCECVSQRHLQKSRDKKPATVPYHVVADEGSEYSFYFAPSLSATKRTNNARAHPHNHSVPMRSEKETIRFDNGTNHSKHVSYILRTSLSLVYFSYCSCPATI